MLLLYGQQLPFREVNSNTTLGKGDCIVKVDTSSGNVTITLPTAVGAKGLPLIVKNWVGSNKVIINTTSSQTVDGLASGQVEIVAKQSLTFVSDDSNWGIF